MKQYFQKLKVAETPEVKSLVLDKGAAARIIKAGLVGQTNLYLGGNPSDMLNRLVTINGTNKGQIR